MTIFFVSELATGIVVKRSKTDTRINRKKDNREANADAEGKYFSDSSDEDKQYIINTFNEKVKDKFIILRSSDDGHDGKLGHWLETQMGITHNSKNEPDIRGYEMKKSSTKITFGDFSASEYAFSKSKAIIDGNNKWDSENVRMSRSEFVRYFGTPKETKHDRFSWSGKCVPKYNVWNDCGQILRIVPDGGIKIYYSYAHDKRDIKTSFPEYLKVDIELLIVVWNSEKLRKHVENKFNVKGFFIIKHNKNKGVFDEIQFGSSFGIDHFIENIKSGKIIFDSGMKDGNSRNYSHFRSASTGFWDELLTQ